MEWADAEGTRFYSKAWEPDPAPKAAVALVHGLGEHAGRYAHVGEAFSQAGYALVALDLRGHGRSGGPRGHVPSAEVYLRDIDLLLEHVRERYRDLPVFLYGHSLGAILVLYYGLRRKPSLAGVIASGPALHSDLENQPVKVMLAKILGGLAPAATVPSGLDASKLSHDPEIERLYRSDPLVHDRTSLGFGKAMLAVNRWTLQHAAEFPLPLLLVHGAEDAIAFPSSSREFAAAAGDRATLLIWEGMYHETHNEPGKAEVLKAILQWMDARPKSA
jgi:alpha-beta hydrolase superfamily lysophospholipase